MVFAAPRLGWPGRGRYARLTRAAICAFALATAGFAGGCDTVSTTVGSLTGAEIARPADPGPLRGADLGAADSVSRPVASVPIKPRSEDPGPAFVVRGRESPPVPSLAAAAAAVTPGAGGKAGDITLNFAGADIRDVAAAVLGDMLKMNYVIDPEISGPVTFNVSRPLSRDDVLPTFEAILNSRGATMSQTNGIVRIMPLRKEASLNPTAGGAPVTAPPAAGPAATAARAGERSESFPLRFVSPTDMQHLLEKVLPPGQTMVADDRRHMLLVQGGARELALAADTVRIFDIDQLSGMSMALVPLRNAQPSAISDELRNIFAATRKEADADAIRFMPIDRLNAVMVLSRSNAYLDEARNWIGRLDRTRDLTERRVYVYNLQYSKAGQVGQKLQGLLTGLDIQFKAPAPTAAETAGQKPEAGPVKTADASGKVPAPPPAAIPVAALADDSAGDSRGGNRNGVRVEADETHNALLISANARDYELIRQVLEGIDVPPLQVLIEVTVAEVVLNDKLNYGVEYFINAGKTNTLLTNASSALGIVPSTPGFALSWISGNFQPRAILDMLSQVTQTKVISTPRLLVLSNQTARLQVGDVVPIITQSATSTVTNNPLILNNVTYKETGVVLEVTPRVNSGGFVTMDVNQSVSDVVNTTTSNIDSPTIRQRRLTSTISVKTGESILLGGLIQQSDSRSNSGIPVLSDLPAVGGLFGTRNNGAGRTELIMLMTPHVIGNEAQARDITGRIASQFQAVLDGTGMIPPRLPQR